LGGLAAAAAIRAGQDFEITVPVLDGGVVLPTLGRVPVPPAAEVVVLRGRSGQLVVTAAEIRPITIADPAAGEDYDGWQRLRQIELVTGTQRLVVIVEDINPFRDCYGRPVLPRLDAAEFAGLRAVLDRAWSLLARDHRRHAAALAALPISLVPLLRPSPGREASATCRDAFGSTGTSIPADPAKLAEILVHEHNHGKLCALQDLVPLHTGESAIRYHAPWRDDLRPVGALLQGAYAHLGVADFWRVHREAVTGAEAQAANREFGKRREQVSNAVDTLGRCDELTAAGHRFVRGMADTLAQWQNEARPMATIATPDGRAGRQH
jgi:HEXXH motif-containing protein